MTQTVCLCYKLWRVDCSEIDNPTIGETSRLLAIDYLCIHANSVVSMTLNLYVIIATYVADAFLMNTLMA